MPNSSFFEERYPGPLRASEQEKLVERRAINQIDPAAPLVGVALSGGGIRSATFCLGLFQALARHQFIRRIDLLSTVSGGGYFGAFLGTAFAREHANAATVERDLADNHSWSVRWLRENGRFLSPNGSGDNWLTAATALRNWFALHVVLLTFALLLLGFATLIRADLCTWSFTSGPWTRLEQFFWNHPVLDVWWSPWLILPVIPFVLLMVPAGTVYWLTQALPLMTLLRRVVGAFDADVLKMTNGEFRGKAQHMLTRVFMLGFVGAVVLLGFGVIDSLGQSAYLRWSANNFAFPSVWAMMTGAGAGLFGFGTKLAVYLERFLGKNKVVLPSKVIALVVALAWVSLAIIGLSATACGLGWRWDLVWDGERFHPMSGGWPLLLAVAICLVASWVFSRSFGFVNLSSMQQLYAARLARAYLGATNPLRRKNANHSMTDLIPGDDVRIDAYAPHRHGGPLHLINSTINETISGKTNIERIDRKGLALAVGPAGLSVGVDSHALWSEETKGTSAPIQLQALYEMRTRAITPIAATADGGHFHALCDSEHLKKAAERADPTIAEQRIEALPLGRWVAISGAAFTTGTGANTSLGLSLLLGLSNVRLGYWWDSGINPGKSGARSKRPTFLELASRLISMALPVQSCLMNEFFARFHGPARRHWYLSDGGHFENTACYELIRRRVPFIICSDAGQDPGYEFADFANLVRKARIDFGAEIQIVRRRADLATDDPGVRFPMPKLEDFVHPNLLDVIGSPEDFPALAGGEEPADQARRPRFARSHALLARIHYTDTNEFCWLLLLKPSLMGDEAADVVQYQRTHPLFPQEPTSDQYFDEAQWESYRKLGEHIGAELFTAPSGPPGPDGAGWSPSQLAPPVFGAERLKAVPAASTPEIVHLTTHAK